MLGARPAQKTPSTPVLCTSQRAVALSAIYAGAGKRLDFAANIPKVSCTYARILSTGDNRDVAIPSLSPVSHLRVEVGAVIGESSRGLNACLNLSLLCVRAARAVLGFWAKGQNLIVVGRSAVDVAEGVSQHSTGYEEGGKERVSTHGTAEGSGRDDVLVCVGFVVGVWWVCVSMFSR